MGMFILNEGIMSKVTRVCYFSHFIVLLVQAQKRQNSSLE